MQDIYICYDEKDKSTAVHIRNYMARMNFTCVNSFHKSGALTEREYQEAKKDSQLFLLDLSQYSNASPGIISQAELAVRLQKHIITFVIDDIDFSNQVKYYLDPYHRYNAYTRPFHKHMKHLADTIGGLLNRERDEDEVSGFGKLTEAVYAFFDRGIGNAIGILFLWVIGIMAALALLLFSIDIFRAVLYPYKDRYVGVTQIVNENSGYDIFFMSKYTEVYGIPIEDGTIQFYRADDRVLVQTLTNPYAGGKVDIGFADRDKIVFISQGLKVSFYDFYDKRHLGETAFEAANAGEEQDILGYLINDGEPDSVVFILGNSATKLAYRLIRYDYAKDRITDEIALKAAKGIAFTRDYRYIEGIGEKGELFLVNAKDYSQPMITGAEALRASYKTGSELWFSEDGNYYVRTELPDKKLTVYSLESGESIYSRKFDILQYVFIDTNRNLLLADNGVIEKINLENGKTKKAKFVKLWEKGKGFNDSYISFVSHIKGTDYFLIFSSLKSTNSTRFYVLDCTDFSLAATSEGFTNEPIKVCVNRRKEDLLVQTENKTTGKRNYYIIDAKLDENAKLIYK